MNTQKILFFSDLEGTILRDSDGKFDDSDFFKLINELNVLGNLTTSDVEIRLVSPIGFTQMTNIINRIEGIISNYFKTKNAKPNVKFIEAAASNHDLNLDPFIRRKISNKIVELRLSSSGRRREDVPSEAKRKYVASTMAAYAEQDICMCIYAGNDFNDIGAMSLIKQRKNGFTICPQNSKPELHKFATYKSSKTDIHGIIDGLENINKNISKRILSDNTSKLGTRTSIRTI